MDFQNNCGPSENYELLNYRFFLINSELWLTIFSNIERIIMTCHNWLQVLDPI